MVCPHCFASRLSQEAVRVAVAAAAVRCGPIPCLDWSLVPHTHNTVAVAWTVLATIGNNQQSTQQQQQPARTFFFFFETLVPNVSTATSTSLIHYSIAVSFRGVNATVRTHVSFVGHVHQNSRQVISLGRRRTTLICLVKPKNSLT